MLLLIDMNDIPPIKAKTKPDPKYIEPKEIIKDKRKVAIVGGSGYVGAELLRLLINHPGIEITAVTSRTHAGKPIDQILPSLQRQ